MSMSIYLYMCVYDTHTRARTSHLVSSTALGGAVGSEAAQSSSQGGPPSGPATSVESAPTGVPSILGKDHPSQPRSPSRRLLRLTHLSLVTGKALALTRPGASATVLARATAHGHCAAGHVEGREGPGVVLAFVGTRVGTRGEGVALGAQTVQAVVPEVAQEETRRG